MPGQTSRVATDSHRGIIQNLHNITGSLSIEVATTHNPNHSGRETGANPLIVSVFDDRSFKRKNHAAVLFACDRSNPAIDYRRGYCDAILGRLFHEGRQRAGRMPTRCRLRGPATSLTLRREPWCTTRERNHGLREGPAGRGPAESYCEHPELTRAVRPIPLSPWLSVPPRTAAFYGGLCRGARGGRRRAPGAKPRSRSSGSRRRRSCSVRSTPVRPQSRISG